MNYLEKKLDELLRRLAYKTMYLNKIPSFNGEKNNPYEILKYNQRYGILPKETIEYEDGSYTYIYENGIKVDVKVSMIKKEKTLTKKKTNYREIR